MKLKSFYIISIVSILSTLVTGNRVLLLNAISVDDDSDAVLQMKAILDEIHDDKELWPTLTVFYSS